MLRSLLVGAALLVALSACNRAPGVWSCEFPASNSCIQWVGEPEENKQFQVENCRKIGGLPHDDVCPIDDTAFGRCDSGTSTTVYYGRRNAQMLAFRCRAAGGTWYGSRAP